MERLWAPWRIAYIKKHSDADPCFLCSAARGRRDVRTHTLLRGKRCFALLNKYPYSTGHVLVAPTAHKAALGELDDTERLELLTLAGEAQAALQKAFRPDGFNLGVNLGRVAGAGLLGHLHLHVVPRWSGDTNFMPVTGATHVMPMSLAQVDKALRKILGRTRR